MSRAVSTPEHPVSPVEPRVVEEAARADEVRLLAALVGGPRREELAPLPVEAYRLRAHIEELAVAREDVRQCDRHVQAPRRGVEGLAAPGDGVAHDLFELQLARQDVELDEPKSAVEEHRPSRDAVRGAVLHEDRAAHRPRRLDLVVGDDPALGLRRAMAPDERAVRRLHAVDPAVPAAEDAELPRASNIDDGRRRVHAPACRVPPENVTRPRVERAHGVLLDLSDERPPARDRDRRELAAELRLPGLPRPRGDLGLARAAPHVVGAERRPGGGRRLGERLRAARERGVLPVCRPALEPRPGGLRLRPRREAR